MSKIESNDRVVITGISSQRKPPHQQKTCPTNLYKAAHNAYAIASEEYVDASLRYSNAMTAATELREAYYAAVAAELKALCDKEVT